MCSSNCAANAVKNMLLETSRQNKDDAESCCPEQDILDSYFRDQGWDPQVESKADFLVGHWIRTAMKSASSTALSREENNRIKLPSSPTSITALWRGDEKNTGALHIMTPILAGQRTLASIPEEDSISTSSIESNDQDQSCDHGVQRRKTTALHEDLRCSVNANEYDAETICLNWLSKTESKQQKKTSLHDQGFLTATGSLNEHNFGRRISVHKLLSRIRAKPRRIDAECTNDDQNRPPLIQTASLDQGRDKESTLCIDREALLENEVDSNLAENRAQYSAAEKIAVNSKLLSNLSPSSYCPCVQDIENEFNLKNASFQLVLEKRRENQHRHKEKNAVVVKLHWLIFIWSDRVIRICNELRRKYLVLPKQEYWLPRLKNGQLLVETCTASTLYFLFAAYLRSAIDTNHLSDENRLSKGLELRLRIIDYESGV